MAVIEQYFPTDPFEVIPEYLIGFVTQHLTVKEALGISEVSKQWYEKTAKTDSFVDRIKLVSKCVGGRGGPYDEGCGSDRMNTVATAATIVNSLRKYSTLEVSRCCTCIQDMQLIFTDPQTLQTWKHVSLINSQFTMLPILIGYIVMMQNSLETLILQNVSVLVSNEVWFQGLWHFPRLTVLKLENFPRQMLQNCFAGLNALKDFKINYFGELSQESANALVRILDRNVNMRKFFIDGTVLHQLMRKIDEDNLIGTFAFKLRKIGITSTYVKENEHLYATLIEFLKSQGENLKAIEFGKFLGFNVLCAVYDLPRLEQLTFRGHINSVELEEWKNFKLNVNESIQHLQVHNSQRIFKSQLTQDLTSAAPNITSFFINWMDDATIHHITATNTKIHRIYIEQFDVRADTIMDYDLMPHLQVMKIRKCNCKALQSIHDRSEAARSNFQRHFYNFLIDKYFNCKVIQGDISNAYNQISEIEPKP